MQYASNLALPPSILTETLAFIGRRGSGKTYGAAKFAELAIGSGGQVIVIDPIGVWWGLRHGAKRNKPGLPVVILGGDHGDLPLAPQSGKLIAGAAVESDRSFVLDVSDMGVGEQRRFVAAFADELYKRNRRAIHVIIDEADEFAPQSGFDGDVAKCLGAIDRMVRRGRARGIGVTMISQRPAVLNKNILTQIEVMFAFQLTGPQDRKAISEWVAVHADDSASRKEFIDAVPKLKNGDSYVWSPVKLKVFQTTRALERATFDSSATPEVGAAVADPGKGADVNLDELRSSMESLAKEQEANDPKKLKAKIAELEKQVASVERALAQAEASESAPDPDLVKECNELRAACGRRDEFIRMMINGVKRTREQIESRLAPILETLPELVKECEYMIAEPDQLERLGKVDYAPDNSRWIQRERPAPKLIPKRTASGMSEPNNNGAAKAHDSPWCEVNGDLSNLTGPERRVIESLLWWRSIGVNCPPRANVAAIAQFHARTKSFLNALGSLRSSGTIDYVDAGVTLLNPSAFPSAPPVTLAEHQDRLRAILKPIERDLFDVVLNSRGRIVPREHIAQQMGRHERTKSLLNALGRLRSLGFIDYESGGVKPTSLAIPEGLK